MKEVCRYTRHVEGVIFPRRIIVYEEQGSYLVFSFNRYLWELFRTDLPPDAQRVCYRVRTLDRVRLEAARRGTLAQQTIEQMTWQEVVEDGERLGELLFEQGAPEVAMSMLLL